MRDEATGTSSSLIAVSSYFIAYTRDEHTLERKDCRKLRTDVVRREARDAAKQRQRSAVHISARAVVTLLVAKRHPLVPLVLNVTREQIAAIAARAKPSRVLRINLVVAVIKISGPTRVASFRVRIEETRQR